MINILINTSSYVISTGLASVLKELACNLNIKIIVDINDEFDDNCHYILVDKKTFGTLNVDQIDTKTKIIIVDDDKEDVIGLKLKIKVQKIFNEIFCTEGVVDEVLNETTEREREIIKFVAKGYTNKQIADELFLSIHTVITHRKNISAKLGIKTISGLTIYAVLKGIIDLP